MIGIFDSGSGGLTVLKALRDELPSANVTYFGDIKNMPYGLKTRAQLSALTVAAIQLLKDRGADKIVSACNSVSASLAVSLYDAFSIASGSLVEMVGPTVSYFKNSPARIALCATPATVDSGIYQSAFHMIGKDVHMISIAELGAAIEHGVPEGEIDKIIRKAFENEPKDFDVLILACTHYPLAFQSFKRVLGDVVIIDPAVAVAERAKKQFWPAEVGEGMTHFILSQDSDRFRQYVAELFPNQQSTIEVLV